LNNSVKNLQYCRFIRGVTDSDNIVVTARFQEYV